MKREIERVINANDRLDKAVAALNEKVKERCSFPASISIFKDDGICVMNEDTSNVAPLSWVLDEMSVRDKLSAEKHEEYCI